jgi:geranylgeranyl diphosphate synthase type I
MDLFGSARSVDKRRARRISFLKSGEYTVEGPLQIGALLAGGSRDVLSALSRYGRPLGEAFQVRDDLNAALSGGSDLRQGRPTFLLAAARARADEPDRRFLDSHVGRELSVPDRDELLALIRRSGAIDEAEALVGKLVDEARAALAGSGLDPAAIASLSGLAELIAGKPT